MFEENIVKLKKDQFTEAESIACLIKDEQKRKMAFLSNCALFAFKNFVEKENYKSAPITKINLFRAPKVYEKYGISDLYIGDARFDVRVSLDGKLFSIPKSHIENSFAADFYVVFKATKNPLKCEALGYIKKSDMVFETQDADYYYISNALLNNIKDLKEEFNTFSKPAKQFIESEHESSIENFAAFLDGELEEEKAQKFIEHLLECEECRGLFVEYNFIEEVLSKSDNYPELKAQLEEELKPQNFPEQTLEQAPELSLEEAAPSAEPVEEPYQAIVSEEELIEKIPVLEEEQTLEIQEPNEEQLLDLSETPLVEESQELVIDETPIEENNEYVLVEEQPLEIQDLNEEQLPDLSETPIVEESQGLVIDETPVEENNEYVLAEEQPLEIQEPNEEQLLDLSETPVKEEPQGLIIDDPSVEENNEYVITEEQPIEIKDAKDEQWLDFSDVSIAEDPQETILDNGESLNLIENTEIEDFVLNEIENNKNGGLELQIPEEEKNVSQEEDSVQEINYNSNWNELFTNNAVNETPVENLEIEEDQNRYITESLNLDNVQNDNLEQNENIENIYNEEVYNDNSINLDMEETAVSPKIKTGTKKSRNPIGGIIAATTTILIVGVAIAGFMVSNGKSNTTVNNPTNNYNPNTNIGTNDINQAMTNAFSDSQALLRVTNVSWLKDKKLEITTELKEYLSALGLAIWDDLDNDIKTVQGYVVSNPTKISIKIDTNGEIASTSIIESCGAEEIDEVILQSVKDATAQLPPSAYSLTGKNIDLILVVNF